MAFCTRMRWMALAFCLGLLAAGCSSVVTTQSLSDAPRPIDRDKFEGVWLLDKAPVFIAFAETGVARIAGVEWKDDEFRLVEGEMVVAEGKENNFLSVRFKQDGEWQENYIFFQYRFTDQGDLVLWRPDVEKFAEAVRANQLQGAVEQRRYGTVVKLEGEPQALIAFMEGPDNHSLFAYREPTVLRRLSGPEPFDRNE